MFVGKEPLISVFIADNIKQKCFNLILMTHNKIMFLIEAIIIFERQRRIPDVVERKLVPIAQGSEVYVRDKAVNDKILYKLIIIVIRHNVLLLGTS